MYFKTFMIINIYINIIQIGVLTFNPIWIKLILYSPKRINKEVQMRKFRGSKGITLIALIITIIILLILARSINECSGWG
jgi:hypothetical protein